MGTLIDLTGQRFGMLTVIERAEDRFSPSGKPVIQWRCRCDCGNERLVDGSNLRAGVTISCGCYKRPKNEFAESDTMAIPIPKPITIKDSLIIGNSYVIKGKNGKLIGLFDTFARFKMEDGHIECFLYWDLERWRYNPAEAEEDEWDE